MSKKTRQVFVIGGVFLLFFLIAALLLFAIPGFIGFDVYYHMAHSAELLSAKNLTIVPQWYTTHFFSYFPADPWWGHHVLSSMFMYLTGTATGMKLMGAFQIALFFSVMYVWFATYTKRPLLFLILFALSSILLMLRLFFVRPYVLSMALLPLIFYLFMRKRHIWAFVVCVLYVLCYNLATPLLLALSIGLVLEPIFRQKNKASIRPLTIVLFAILVGLILHPHTTGYVFVIYTHTVEILRATLFGVPLPKGIEIQLQDPIAFVGRNAIFLALYVLAMVPYLSKLIEKDKTIQATPLILSAPWFFVAAVIPRGIEYWWSFGSLAILYSLTHAITPKEKKLLAKQCSRYVHPRIALFLVGGAMALLYISNIAKVGVELSNRTEALAHTRSLEQVATYLNEHAPEGSILTTPVWSDSTMMLLTNTRVRYTTAFDPIFLYSYNEESYYLWYNMFYHAQFCNHKLPCPLSDPKQAPQQFASILTDVFQSSYILIPKESKRLHTEHMLPLAPLLAHTTSYFELVYENDMQRVYRIK